MVARIPVAHVHGGEVTEGAIDDTIRHSITKMAHWHFTAAEPFRHRIIQMGEEPDRVFTVGAPGLDYLEHLDVMDLNAMEASLNLSLTEPTFLVTYHPATLGDSSPGESINEVLQALDAFPEAQIIFTRANADTEGRVINQAIDRYVESGQGCASVFTSLGQRRYLSLLHHVNVVIGNSSSGIIEAPSIPVATVNIGDRQKGRPRASSVIDCEEDAESIVEAIEQALSSAFKKMVEEASSLYGDGGASKKIVERLSQVNLPAPRKQFYDIELSRVH
jgi:UDP-N-acetylglucosamine 2-epimerase (non-hydrolysing)/GDP/UDP-N,N'-diacetylbacillosamine 2-epimerase (hydrolysing)